MELKLGTHFQVFAFLSFKYNRVFSVDENVTYSTQQRLFKWQGRSVTQYSLRSNTESRRPFVFHESNKAHQGWPTALLWKSLRFVGLRSLRGPDMFIYLTKDAFDCFNHHCIFRESSLFNLCCVFECFSEISCHIRVV